LVTEETHNLATGEFVKIASNQSSFNYDSVKIKSDLVAISSYTSKTQTGETEDDYKWQVTFAIPSQTLTPLAPTYINITGTSVTASATYQNVTVDETSGNGLGAIFTVVKGGSGTVYNAVTTIKLTDAGSGYRAKDTITIYGSQLGGVDGVNDLTFTISNGLEVYYQIKGNSNSTTTTTNTSTKALSITNLSLKAYPNPTSHYFNVVVEGGAQQTEGVLRVMNMVGQLIEEKKQVKPGQLIQLGHQYINGMYLIEYTQGSDRTTIKVNKH
jgi:hypothetical protein